MFLPANGVYKIQNLGTGMYLGVDNNNKMVMMNSTAFKVGADSFGIFAISYYDDLQWKLKDQIPRGAFEDVATLQLQPVQGVSPYGFFAPKEEICVVFVSPRD